MDVPRRGGTDLDVAVHRRRRLLGPGDGGVRVRYVDHEGAAELLLGVRERSVLDEETPVLRLIVVVTELGANTSADSSTPASSSALAYASNPPMPSLRASSPRSSAVISG